MNLYLIVNIIGILAFLLIAFLFSKNKKLINWKSIIIMLILNIVIAWFLTSFSIGVECIKAAAKGFNWIVNIAYTGISFALPNWVHVKNMNFITSALLPILMIVPLFDILNYIGILPLIIKGIGWGLSKITGQPKFESFYAVEMMFLGNTEALAVSSLQLKKINEKRNLTIAMMSMSCVTASILGAYMKMMPGQFILTAVPINIINSIIVTSLLNPIKVSPSEDIVASVETVDESGTESIETSGSQVEAEKEVKEIEARRKEFNQNYINKKKNIKKHKGKREPFFSFLGDSILGAGRLILIITANVIAFVALANLINKLLQFINPWLTLQHILGIILYPCAWLLGLDSHHAFQFAQYMGTKLVTNEFVVMGEVSPIIHSFAPHFKAILTIFLTSFANFSTVGMIIGAFKSLVNKKKNDLISRNVGYMLLSGVLVSLLSAGIVGLFVW